MEQDKGGDGKYKQTSPRTPHRFSRRTRGQSPRNVSYQPALRQPILPQTTPLQATTYQSETPQTDSTESEWYSAQSQSGIDLSESLQTDIQQAELLRTPQQSAPPQILPWQSAPQKTVSMQFAAPQTLQCHSAPPQPRPQRRLRYSVPLQPGLQQIVPQPYITVQYPQTQYIYNPYLTWHRVHVQPAQMEWQPELLPIETYQPRRLFQSPPQQYIPSQIGLPQPGPSQIGLPQPGPSQIELPQPGPSHIELPQPGPSQPGPQQTETLQPPLYQLVPTQFVLPQPGPSQPGPQQTETLQPLLYQLVPTQLVLPQPGPSQPEPHQTERWQFSLYPNAPLQVELSQSGPQQTETLQPSSYQYVPPQSVLPQPGPSQPEPQQTETLQPPSHSYALPQTGPSQPTTYHLASQPSTSRKRGSSLSRLQQPKRKESVRQSQSLQSGAENTEDFSDEGQEIKLLTNYFKIISPPDWTLYQYSIKFVPTCSVPLRIRIVRLIRTPMWIYSFDGHILYAHHRLFKDEDAINTTIPDNGPVTLNIRFVGIVNINERCHQHFFSLMIKKSFAIMQLRLIRRNYYDPQNKIRDDSHSFEVWSGFFTSIRRHQRNFLMCVDTAHKIIHLNTLLDIWKTCQSSRNENPQLLFQKKVERSIIVTRYNNYIYQIIGVDFKLTPMHSFKKSKSEESITYQNYYNIRYGINLQDHKQPMLIATRNQRTRNLSNQMENIVYLIPELCYPTDLTDDIRTQFPKMAALASHTQILPEKRITRLLEFNKKFSSNSKVMENLQKWDLTLDNKLIEIEGHILPQEKVFFHNDSVYIGKQANWTSSMSNIMLTSVKSLECWAVICLEECRHHWEKFLQILISEAKKIGFKMQLPSHLYFLDDISLVQFSELMENIASKNPLQLMVCVDSKVHVKRYSTLKKKFCLDRPIPSQMIVLKERTENLTKSIAKKLAIQINCKLGGAPWYVDIPIEGLMVIGFDVCHDKRRTDSNFGATVASLDNKLTRYISAVSKHNENVELSNDIADHVCQFVSAYRDNNDNKYPNYIIIYRDGVGESQIESVYKHEVEKIKKELNEKYNVEIKMAFIIVSKRVNTRIFYNKSNPPCGTVVDSVITGPTRNDFFIVSQHVQQGTVTPTLYTVIYNSLDLHEIMLQQITYKLTHMYYNWSGTIRVPAPCQYAHKLAYLVSVYINQEPHNDIKNLLYYL